MSRLLSDLTPTACQKAKSLLEKCKHAGVDMLVTCTYRSPEEQARLYRQSRGIDEIQRKAESLKVRGFGYLAKILMEVGPQPFARQVTCAAPGESYHQARLAVDCVPMRGGKPVWDAEAPEWQVYGKLAREVGLEWGGSWMSFREYPHVQMAQGGNPTKVYSPIELKRIMGI